MLDDLHYDSYTQDCADRRAHSCSVFQMNNAGFHAEITLDKENLVFFSVPYDDGFTAYVNGEKTDILQVDEGLMAVLCPAGAPAASTLCIRPPGFPPAGWSPLCRNSGVGGVRCMLCAPQAPQHRHPGRRMTLTAKKIKILNFLLTLRR